MAIANLICICLYLAATAYTIILLSGKHTASKLQQNIIYLLPILLHSIIVGETLITTQGLQVSLFNIFSLAAWLVCLLLLIYNLKRQMAVILVFALPTTALSIVFAHLYPHDVVLTHNSSLTLLHIASSILAYALLTLATLQAIQLAIIEKRLKSNPAEMNPLFPPLDTVESFLFNLIWFGFALLTISLLSSLWLDAESLKSQPLHKAIFSVISWLIYAWLLWGRYQKGWRGKKAVKLTITGFTLLLIAYFGTKFVLEFLL